MPAPQSFTMRGAQSTSLLAGVAIATVVEGLALHLLLAPAHPTLAYALEALGVLTFVWLWRVFGSVARGTVTVHDDAVVIDAGSLAQATIPRATIARVERASWKDLPQKGTPDAVGYLNATGPTEPAVVLHLNAPVAVRLLGLSSRQATRIALWVDDAPQFQSTLANSLP
jgi:hypothetical protein